MVQTVLSAAMFDLSGRVALVTGAGQGMGRGIAMALATQGAAVAVNDYFEDRAKAAAADLPAPGKARAIGIAADVTDLDAINGMVSRVESELGPIDILVNNAGIPAEGMELKTFRDMPIEEWDKYVRLNLYGVLYCTRSVIDGMCEREWGRIVTVSSEAGRIGAGAGVTLYGAAKAGAVSFSRHLAMEVARYGVTVNCVSLGLMNNNPSGQRGEAAGVIPRGRAGTADDVGPAVAYLCSEEAAWVTGQTLPINGGLATN